MASPTAIIYFPEGQPARAGNRERWQDSEAPVNTTQLQQEIADANAVRACMHHDACMYI